MYDSVYLASLVQFIIEEASETWLENVMLQIITYWLAISWNLYLNMAPITT